MSFTFEKTKLPGVIIIQPQIFGDNRGYFMETFKKGDYIKELCKNKFTQFPLLENQVCGLMM